MSILRGIRTPCLQKCAAAFESNMIRTSTFAISPAEIAYMVRRDQIIYDNAIFKVTGRGEIRLEDFMSHSPPDGVEEDAQRRFQEFKEMSEDRRKEYTGFFGITYIQMMAERHPGMASALDALFASVVLGSWTAFECLASDVWVEAVNHGPKEFRQKVERARHVRERKDALADDAVPSDIDPTVNLGEYLREERLVSFQTFPSIQKFYSVLFDKDTISKLFKESDPYISALAAVRNILAHKAGIADKTFEKQVKDFPEFNQFKDGKEVELDGATAKRLYWAAAVVGTVLLSHVDDILTPP